MLGTVHWELATGGTPNPASAGLGGRFLQFMGKRMSIRRVTASLGMLLIVAGLTHGCGTTARELIMEVPTPQTAIVGRNEVVRVIFRNLPEEGSVIDMTWYGFGVQGEPMEATVELPPSPGASGDRMRLQLVWESSNASILGGQVEPPTLSSPNDAKLRPGARDVSLEFYFETLSTGTTELSLTLTTSNGSVVRQNVVVTVAR